MTPTRRAALSALREQRVTILWADGVLLPDGTQPAHRVRATVASSRKDRRLPYVVMRFADGAWTCTCGRDDCAHVAAVQLITGHASAAAKEVAA